MTRVVTVKSTGEAELVFLGSFKFVFVKAATAPFQISFDGSTFSPANQNDRYALGAPQGSLSLMALNGNAATVTLLYSDQPISSQDTAQSNAKSFILGNLGVATAPALNGDARSAAQIAAGLPVADVNGYLQITAAMRCNIPGVTGTARRQLIFFSVSPNSQYPVTVLDPNSSPAGDFAAITIAPGQQIQLTTDSQLLVSGAGGTALVTIGQIFLNNG